MGRRRSFLASGAAVLITPLIASCTRLVPPDSVAAPPIRSPDTAASNPPPGAAPVRPPGGFPAPSATASRSPISSVARGNVEFWHFWGSPPRRAAMQRVVGAFRQRYAGIGVVETFVPFGDIWAKSIAAVAAGSGMPDVLVEDRRQLGDRARNHVDLGLGALAGRDRVTGDAFWPLAWQEVTIDGQPFGLPFETDVSVTFFNRAAYADAGLAPTVPPKSWDDLWAFADRLDRKAGARIEQIGFYPLLGMDLEQWAWNNGGAWQDRDFNPTINAPPNVETLAWIKRWTDRYGKANLDAFRRGFGQGPQDPFMSGRVATQIDATAYASFLRFYNPDFAAHTGERLGFGVAPVPPAPGKRPGSRAVGYALSIPRGTTQLDAAWEFVKFAVFVGQISWARDTFALPTIQDVARNDPTLNAQPAWPTFLDALDFGRPTFFNPYYPRMLDLLGPAVEEVLAGRKTPKAALDDAQRQAEAEVAQARTA